MIVTFDSSSINATPETQDEQDVFAWLADRIDSLPLIKFHLEALVNQRVAQMHDEIKETLLARVKSGELANPLLSKKVV